MQACLKHGLLLSPKASHGGVRSLEAGTSCHHFLAPSFPCFPHSPCFFFWASLGTFGSAVLCCSASDEMQLFSCLAGCTPLEVQPVSCPLCGFWVT